jgi:hypothetical protein
LCLRQPRDQGGTLQNYSYDVDGRVLLLLLLLLLMMLQLGAPAPRLRAAAFECLEHVQHSKPNWGQPMILQGRLPALQMHHTFRKGLGAHLHTCTMGMAKVLRTYLFVFRSRGLRVAPGDPVASCVCG